MGVGTFLLMSALAGELGGAGLGYAFVRRGESPVCAGLGTADRSTGRAITGDTIFPVASVSKLFLGLAVGQLMAQRAIPMTTPLDDLVPGLARARDNFRSRLADLGAVERGVAMLRTASPELLDGVDQVLMLADDFGREIGVPVMRDPLLLALRAGVQADALGRELYLDLNHFREEANRAGDMNLARLYGDAATAANKMQHNHWRWVSNLDFFKNPASVRAEVTAARRDVTAFRTAMARVGRYAPGHIVARGDELVRAAAAFESALPAGRTGGWR